MRKSGFKILLTILLLHIVSCAEELDYPEQARKFYAQYAQSLEITRMLHYGIRRREQALYLQKCERTSSDSVKAWAIYDNYPFDDDRAEIGLTNLQMAFTPFEDAGGGRIVPQYETIADTAGRVGQAVLEIRETIRAFHRLGMREVICGGQGVVYLVQPKFMLIHVADSAQVPEGVKNVATKLDANWFFEISFELQDAQRRKLSTALREFWENVQLQKAQQEQMEKQP